MKLSHLVNNICLLNDVHSYVVYVQIVMNVIRYAMFYSDKGVL